MLINGPPVIDACFAAALKRCQEGAHLSGVASKAIKQETFEIAGDLNIHGRADGLMHITTPIHARVKEYRENVVFVGCENEFVHRQPHALREITGEDVAEVASRHAEIHRHTCTNPQACIEVINNLRQHPRPVHGVHRAQLVLRFEVQIAEHFLHDSLTVIETPAHRDVEDVVFYDGGHLHFLQTTGASQGIHHKYTNALSTAHACDRSATRITAGRTEDIEMLIARLEQIFEDTAEYLQSNVFERQRRAVKQLEYGFVRMRVALRFALVQRDERRYILGIEACIRIAQ